MPKVKRRIGKKDKYYQEWHIDRKQTAFNTDEEFVIDVPRPLVAPAPGRYWALEIHSIEHQVSSTAVLGIAAYLIQEFVSLGTRTRVGNTQFVSSVSCPDNLWFYLRNSHMGLALFVETTTIDKESRHSNKSAYTDDLGHGKLLIGDRVYLQVSSSGHVSGGEVRVELSIEYTWTTIPCDEYVQELASQLQES